MILHNQIEMGNSVTTDHVSEHIWLKYFLDGISTIVVISSTTTIQTTVRRKDSKRLSEDTEERLN